MSMSIELDEKRRKALERAARRRKSSAQQLLEQAVDAFIERAEDEELLKDSSRAAKRTGLHERDAVQIVRDWRQFSRADVSKVLEIDQETESLISKCAEVRGCTIREAMIWLLKIGARQGERWGYIDPWEEEQAQNRKAG